MQAFGETGPFPFSVTSLPTATSPINLAPPYFFNPASYQAQATISWLFNCTSVISYLYLVAYGTRTTAATRCWPDREIMARLKKKTHNPPSASSCTARRGGQKWHQSLECPQTLSYTEWWQTFFGLPNYMRCPYAELQALLVVQSAVSCSQCMAILWSVFKARGKQRVCSYPGLLGSV